MTMSLPSSAEKINDGALGVPIGVTSRYDVRNGFLFVFLIDDLDIQMLPFEKTRRLRDIRRKAADARNADADLDWVHQYLILRQIFLAAIFQ